MDSAEKPEHINRNSPGIQEHHNAQSLLLGLRRLYHSYLIFALSTISFLNSFGLGITTIALPQIASDLEIPSGLTLWPGTVNTLALACCLLPAGAVADIVGARRVSLAGTLILAAFTIACGVSSSSTALIVFRALAGLGAALVQPSSVSIISHNTCKGRIQNIGFSCLGLSIPFGFASGLILGGVFTSTTVGWRLGFYLCGGLLSSIFVLNFFILPRDRISLSRNLWFRTWREVDWVGAGLFAMAFALLSYSFSLLTEDLQNIRSGPALATMCVGVLSLPACGAWACIQQRRQQPTLLPHHVWTNKEFLCVCCVVFCVWAVLNSMEWFFSIYFQTIQGLSALESAIRFLPNLILGIMLEIFIGAYIHLLPVVPTIVASVLVSSVSPILMALIDPGWSFWHGSFWAMLLLPVAIDVLFTVVSLLITDIFPKEMHALAGAVFNVVAQMGTAGGIAMMALIASGVSQNQPQSTPSGPQQESSDGIQYTIHGLVAVFWSCFGLSFFAAVIAPIGLWRRKRVGLGHTPVSRNDEETGHAQHN